MNPTPPVLAAAMLALGAVMATEPAPKEPTPPPAEAVEAVQTRIVARLRPEIAPFSRVATPMPETRFHPQILAEGERRLPFEVLEPMNLRLLKDPSAGQRAVLVSGYVRVPDHAVFIFNTATQKHIPAAKDPRFAPEQREAETPVTPAKRT